MTCSSATQAAAPEDLDAKLADLRSPRGFAAMRICNIATCALSACRTGLRCRIEERSLLRVV